MSALPENKKSLDLGKLLDEAVALWRLFPSRGWLLFLLACWITLFQFWGNSTLGYIKTPSLFRWVQYSYEMWPDDSHGYYLPFLVLLMLWWNRKDLIPIKKGIFWPALGLFILAIAIHFFGFAVQQTRISIVAFYVGIYALTGLLWGWAWMKVSFYPFCLFAFSVPLASHMDIVSFPLRQGATVLTTWFAQGILGIEVIQRGTAIFDPTGNYQYEVAAACSGLRSLTALFMLSLVYGYLFFSSFWRRGVVFLMAIPAAIISNVLRLLMIVVAAQFFGQEGGNYVHNSDLLSFLPYLIGFSLVFVMGFVLKEKRSENEKDSASSKETATSET